MGNLAQDLKHGFRTLLRSPGFTSVAVIVLALGIGANTAIFSVVNAVLLQPLPFPDPARLVQIWHVPPAKSFPGFTRFSVSAANYADWAAQNRFFEQTAIYAFSAANLTGRDRPEAVRMARVSAGFFPLLRVQPLLGRTFAPAEDQLGHGQVVILSYAFWQTHFGSDPRAVGQSVSFEGQPYSIVGVMRANFRFPEFAQAWIPMAWSDQERSVRGEHHYGVIARLNPGVALPQAQAEMSSISSRLEQQYPEDDKGWGAVVVPLREQLVGGIRLPLLVLLGAVAFVLLIACANVMNLVLARTLARQKEAAIRAVLGASRARVLQQVMAETILLALAGGALGLFLAQFGVSMIVAFFGDNLPHTSDVRLDAWVLGFTVLVSLATGVVAGLAPAWRLTRANLNDALKLGLGRTDADTGGGRLRSVLVVSEVALSLVLLIGSGLLIRSLWMLRSVDPGIDTHNVLTMYLPVSNTRFATPAQQIAFFDQVLRHVQALPGVESAGTIDSLPLNGGGSNQPIVIEGRPAGAMSEQPEVGVRLVSPGYFSALRLHLLRGRTFNDSDAAGNQAVIVISASMARRFWGQDDPLGKRLTLSFLPQPASREIVGIVGDVKQDGLDVADTEATLYVPMGQISVAALGGWRSFGVTLAVRTSTDPAAMSSAIAGAIHQVNADQPVAQVLTMDQVLTQSISSQRFNMLLLAAFAGLALLLAAVGIYSVLSYTVRRRSREIGIRIALGAQLRDVLRMVVLDGMKPTLIGLAIGLAGAFALGRVLAGLVFGVSPSDPATFAAVSFLLAMVALFAILVPAFRATRVDPMTVLRDE